MQLKLGLVSTLVAAASASVMPFIAKETAQTNIMNVHDYTDRDINTICFTTRPVKTCEPGHLVGEIKREYVSLTCMDKNSEDARLFKSKIDRNEDVPELRLSMGNQNGYVETPVTCFDSNVLDTDKEYARYQNLHGERIELVDKDDLYLTSMNNEHEVKEINQYVTSNKFRGDKMWRDNRDRSSPKTYSFYLNELRSYSINDILSLSDEQFNNFYNRLGHTLGFHNFVISPEMQNNLPTYFAEVAKDYYSLTYSQNKILDYTQYKNLIKRVYAYIVKEVMIYSYTSPKRYVDSSEYVRKVWEKVLRGMTRAELRKVERVVEKYYNYNEKDLKLKRFTSELVVPYVEHIQESILKNMIRLLAIGLIRNEFEYFYDV